MKWRSTHKTLLYSVIQWLFQGKALMWCWSCAYFMEPHFYLKESLTNYRNSHISDVVRLRFHETLIQLYDISRKKQPSNRLAANHKIRVFMWKLKFWKTCQLPILTDLLDVIHANVNQCGFKYYLMTLINIWKIYTTFKEPIFPKRPVHHIAKPCMGKRSI